MTTYICRTMGIASDELSQAEDGDTIRLAWSGAQSSKAIVESWALRLGLDVVIEVEKEVWVDNTR